MMVRVQPKIFLSDSADVEDCLGRQSVGIDENSTMWLLDFPQAHNGK